MRSYVPRIELQPGYSISKIIKGGWQLAGGHGSFDERQEMRSMAAFVRRGITTFDCADIYSGVEELIGKFLRKYKHAFLSGSLPQIQIHTKYVPDLEVLPRLTKENVEPIIDRSLKRLGIERLDLVQFHWWDFSIPGYVEAAGHLFDMQQAGKIRYIGVTNFDASHLKELFDVGLPVISNQIQFSVLDNRPEKEIHLLARQQDIRLLCYGTLAGGFINDSWLGAASPEEPLENRSLVKYRLIIEEFGGWDLFQELLSVLNDIAGRYEVGIAEVAARYVLQKPAVAAIIVGARSTRYIERIKKFAAFELTEEDLRIIQTVLDRSRGPRGPVYGLERDRNGPHGRIMKYNLNKSSS